LVGLTECPIRPSFTDEKDKVMSKQTIANQLAGVAFLVIAIVEYARDSSGTGTVFLVFAGVFLAPQFRARR
jgi:hypothetical protein